ncbi:hypothetical protein M1M07_16700 [Rhodococcus sp. HM1]|uniref:hypothetical protein n=1 Tax=Rhodococcus sp. HM1 TaxID=2937759 RepID=UPI00200B8454|nr:hypothetical protein [Rhodococcus sp. HM1]MCK8672738.1 hypothetical protein [Rhodococcus sp. HM1]
MNDDTSAVGPGGRPARARTGSVKRNDSPKRSGTFIYPLPSTPLPSSTPMTSSPGPHAEVSHASDRNPAGGVGAGTTTEGTSPVSSTSTNGTSSNGIGATPATTTELGSLPTGGPAVGPARRNSMGQASVRIAARLAHGELATRTHRSHASDPTVDNDELLSLLGEYLLAGGLEKPEIHATLGGQPIVVDLQAPQRPTR